MAETPATWQRTAAINRAQRAGKGMSGKEAPPQTVGPAFRLVQPKGKGTPPPSPPTPRGDGRAQDAGSLAWEVRGLRERVTALEKSQKDLMKLATALQNSVDARRVEQHGIRRAFKSLLERFHQIEGQETETLRTQNAVAREVISQAHELMQIQDNLPSLGVPRSVRTLGSAITEQTGILTELAMRLDGVEHRLGCAEEELALIQGDREEYTIQSPTAPRGPPAAVTPPRRARSWSHSPKSMETDELGSPRHGVKVRTPSL